MENFTDKIIQGDSLDILKKIPSESINMIITSPPYWSLRDYNMDGQIGLEDSFEEYINKLCDIFEESKRVLKKDGTLFVNLGDSYSGSGKGYGDKKPDPKMKSGGRERTIKPKKSSIPDKSLLMIPERFAIEMCNRGWILRNQIIWHKPNVMPSSAKDRFTVDFEKIFFFVKSKKYYFDADAVKEDSLWKGDQRAGYGRLHYRGKREGQKGTGQENFVHITERRNKRTVWKVSTKPFKGAHFAVYPNELIKIPILSGCPRGGIVLDPFIGSGTTAIVAKSLDRKYIGIELNPEYIKIAEKRIIENISDIKK